LLTRETPTASDGEAGTCLGEDSPWALNVGADLVTLSNGKIKLTVFNFPRLLFITSSGRAIPNHAAVVEENA
jgi:hypothetical protein